MILITHSGRRPPHFACFDKAVEKQLRIFVVKIGVISYNPVDHCLSGTGYQYVRRTILQLWGERKIT